MLGQRCMLSIASKHLGVTAVGNIINKHVYIVPVELKGAKLPLCKVAV